MGTITARRRGNGTTGYTAQIRLKREGRIVHTEAETFNTKAHAREWLTRREAELNGQRARGEAVGRRMTVDQMIEWYQGRERPDKPWGRTKRADLARMKAGPLSGKRADQLTRADFIAYTEWRRAEGAGPATASNDLIWFRQVFRSADAVLGCPVPMGALDRAAEYLRQSRLIAKPQKRDRRLRDGEEEKILKPVKAGYEKYGKDGDIEHIQGVQELENYRFDLEPLGGQMAKEDRIKRLEADFENGRWWLPKALPRTLADGTQVDIVERFVNAEYLTFPAGLHDDMLDAVARIYDIGARFPKPLQAVTRRGASRESAGFNW